MRFKRKPIYIVLVVVLWVMIYAFSTPYEFVSDVSPKILSKVLSASLSLMGLAIFAMIFGSDFEFVENMAAAMLSIGLFILGVTGLITFLIRGGVEVLYSVPLSVVVIALGIGMFKEHFLEEQKPDNKVKKMKLKQKLAYIALGGVLVIIGQLLPTVLVPKGVAPGKVTSADFDTVKCRILKVVDKTGRVRAQLEVMKRPSGLPGDNVFQIFNRDGSSVYQVGVSPVGGLVAINGNNGKPHAGIGAGDSGGAVSVYGNDGNLRVWMVVIPRGGSGIYVFNQDGDQAHVSIEVTEDGDGSVKLELIAPEEIEVAIKNVISNALGMERADIPQEACRLFGFKAVSENMRQQVEKVVNKMIKQGQLACKGNSLVVCEAREKPQ